MAPRELEEGSPLLRNPIDESPSPLSPSSTPNRKGTDAVKSGGNSSSKCAKDAVAGSAQNVVKILVEIVGATGLSPARPWAGACEGTAPFEANQGVVSGVTLPSTRILLGHDGKANTYCSVTFGGRVVHRTKIAAGGNDPIWTVGTGSLFMLSVSYDELVGEKEKVLTFELRDKDTILRTSERIGSVRVKAKTLLENCTETRIEFPLNKEIIAEEYGDGVHETDDPVGRQSVSMNSFFGADSSAEGKSSSVFAIAH